MALLAIVLCTVAIVGGFGSWLLMWACTQKKAEAMDAEANDSYHLPNLPPPLILYRQNRRAQEDWAAAQIRAQRSQNNSSSPMSTTPNTRNDSSSPVPAVYNTRRTDQATSIQAPAPVYQPDSSDADVMNSIMSCPASKHIPHDSRVKNRSRFLAHPARSPVRSIDVSPLEEGRRAPAGSWLSRLLPQKRKLRPAPQSTNLQLLSQCQNPFREPAADLSRPDPFLEQAMGQGYAYGMGGVRGVG